MVKSSGSMRQIQRAQAPHFPYGRISSKEEKRRKKRNLCSLATKLLLNHRRTSPNFSSITAGLPPGRHSTPELRLTAD
ncbi:hypothetical protein M5K25_004233 [Dendrobium thyrsiflorum]|uniref:Uncharacterized protein n=1 Tax=Dendrobium thyrsiflorum TaxID=117978 RepID=A0ABD0VM56_DENTH